MRSALGTAAGLTLTLVASSISPAWAQAAFSDQTFDSGLDHIPFMVDTMAAERHYPGGTVGDFDRDGWPDIFLLGGGQAPDALYINNQDGTFSDQTTDWGVALTHRGRGAAAGDFDGDGWTDIYVTSGGDLSGPDRAGQHLLYRNNGDGTFTDVAATAFVNQTSATAMATASAAFGDYDLDGDLDLFVCTWDIASTNDGNRLFQNNGSGTFSDATTSAGILVGMSGFSPRFVDMNGDRYPELLVAADFRTSRYYINDRDGTFTDYTLSSGTGLESNGMGHAVADFNRDGMQDWYVTSIFRDEPLYEQDGNYLYVNQGNDVFSAPDAHGARDGGWGWGTEALDFDHDGHVDLAETNGYEDSQFYAEQAYLYRNKGDLTFTPVQSLVGFDHNWEGRSLMTLDYDRDGDMDILITAYNGLVALYRNDLGGPDTHWLEVFLDTSANPFLAPEGFGSVVRATTGTVTQSSYLSPGATYLGQSQALVHFGLGAATSVDQLVVEWADGSTTVMNDVAADQILTVAAPAGSGAPGEASDPIDPAGQMIARYNESMGMIEIDYVPACDATDHTIYYGDLAHVGSYLYVDAVCRVGGTGSATFDTGGLDNAFFLIVGNDGVVEGSFGVDGLGAERPEDLSATDVCELPRDLTGTCR